MKENEKKKPDVLITESSHKSDLDTLNDNSTIRMERFKKPLIFSLLGIVFLGSMYLIFTPSSSNKVKKEDFGLNEDVPQASDKGLQSDKQKAYEEEILKEKEQEKQTALTSLSDYWNAENSGSKPSDTLKGEEEMTNNTGSPAQAKTNPALTSYRNIQSTLGGFYQDNNSQSSTLRKELEELKKQLAMKESVPVNPVETQLALMEKSYQMASRYFPKPSQDDSSQKESKQKSATASPKQKSFVAFLPLKKDVVSELYREPTDAEFLKNWREKRNRGFIDSDTISEVIQPKNSIRACIHETQTVTLESNVRLRLLEDATTPDRTIPKGTLLTAMVKFKEGRLQLQVISMELEGNIIPVDITVYDLDGQQGLYVPYSAEMSALTEMAANMGTTTGTNLMLTSSAGQQIAADMSKGVIQGVSSYFSKKVKTPKITLKADHLLFLVSKK
ncbi:conjugative transposon protein TraM [Flavobacterium plurextorum]|uniref:Conjugative transposon protein TraM n=1 Tax=Flavobacterium oncorhynchi TaxID=728056 RepID=A0A226HXW5_9FLAO|nr:conjugative transposon protein TraM [Flavobacterium oncorhynchi]OXA99157.1 conjugative transposon protein TraM [Flavobacterium oncorhynchi]